MPIPTRRTEDTRRSSCCRVRSEGCHRHKQSSTHTNPCTPRASHPARRGRPSTPTRPPPCPRRRGRGAHNVARTNRCHGRRGPLRGRTIPRRTPRTRRRCNRRPSSCCPPVPRPAACPRVAPPRPRTDRRWNLARRPLSPRWNLVKRPLGPRLTRPPRCCPPHRPPRQWTALPPLPPLQPLQPLQPLRPPLVAPLQQRCRRSLLRAARLLTNPVGWHDAYKSMWAARRLSISPRMPSLRHLPLPPGRPFPASRTPSSQHPSRTT